MAADAGQAFYQGDVVQNFELYLQKTGEHDAVFQCIQDILPREFKKSVRLSFQSLFEVFNPRK